MEVSHPIRDAMTRVADLRSIVRQSPDLAQAVAQIKEFQAQRFVATYPDLFNSPVYQACAEFFLTELYGSQDFSQRDAQFARIAGALEKTFPRNVVDMANTLAQLHCVTEELDLAMANQWAQTGAVDPPARYRLAWCAVGQRAQREWQLATVIQIGQVLSDLTRKRGLRLMLKMMHRPAHLAGLGALQVFLEAGFDHFGTMAKNQNSVKSFLDIIQKRESDWIVSLFNS